MLKHDAPADAAGAVYPGILNDTDDTVGTVGAVGAAEPNGAESGAANEEPGTGAGKLP